MSSRSTTSRRWSSLPGASSAWKRCCAGIIHQRGLLLPEDFLPIAEKFGIMQQLGRWALDGACRQMSLWRAQQLPVPVVAINVALAQINAWVPNSCAT